MPNNDGTMTPLMVQTFVKTAKPLQRLIYHVGNLAAERIVDKSLSAIAKEAYEAAEKGECALLQKRYGRPEEGNTIYMLERRGI